MLLLLLLLKLLLLRLLLLLKLLLLLLLLLLRLLLLLFWSSSSVATASSTFLLSQHFAAQPFQPWVHPLRDTDTVHPQRTAQAEVRFTVFCDRLLGLVVKALASTAEDPGFESRFAPGFFRGRVIPATSKLALQWLACQAPGVIGSVLRLVGPVSAYCDWVR